MIPEGWEAMKLGSIANKVTSGARDWAKHYSDSGAKFIRMTNLSRDGIHLNLEKLKYVDIKNSSTDGQRTSLQEGDILISITAELGKIGLVPHDLGQSYINQHTALVRVNCSYVSPIYIAYLLSSRPLNYTINRMNDAGAKSGLNLSTVKAIPISLPPLPEQKKIAQILSTWDKAIETVEKLIANSQQKKKALMQQLLTGKKRFPEFDGEWKEVRLGELCKFMKGKGLSKGKVSNSGQYKCILYGELYTRYSEVIGEAINRTDHNEGVKSESGDILIPASTTTSGIDLANATSLKESGVLLSGDINILRTDKNLINPDFLAYVLTHVKKYDLARRAQGITIIHLYGKDIKHIKITLPSLAEQQKIASILSESDSEIKTWQQELEHLKQEKKALMQQLLTGKRRVKLSKQENHHANLL